MRYYSRGGPGGLLAPKIMVGGRLPADDLRHPRDRPGRHRSAAARAAPGAGRTLMREPRHAPSWRPRGDLDQRRYRERRLTRLTPTAWLARWRCRRAPTTGGRR